MAASLGLSRSQQQKSGKQKNLSYLESNKENRPFEKFPTKKENHVERMDVSPLIRREMREKHTSQVREIKEEHPPWVRGNHQEKGQPPVKCRGRSWLNLSQVWRNQKEIPVKAKAKSERTHVSKKKSETPVTGMVEQKEIHSPQVL